MGKFAKFLYYNIIVYFLYVIVDKFFTMLHLYSSDALGTDLSVMPTNSDLTLIIINVVISSVGGYFLLKKLEEYLSL
ncbi:hypothetical protein [Sulfurimonas sp.]|uniref:hypothetical protein n=1 Tax=Sulfurimonas sp. TaxID=2022749 RepID=UPI0026359BDC|nr:hypothetical protein [Sulfurimonas sp.]